eukprot:Gb_11414 [translate_table: standard]
MGTLSFISHGVSLPRTHTQFNSRLWTAVSALRGRKVHVKSRMSMERRGGGGGGEEGRGPFLSKGLYVPPPWAAHLHPIPPHFYALGHVSHFFYHFPYTGIQHVLWHVYTITSDYADATRIRSLKPNWGSQIPVHQTTLFVLIQS